MQRSSTFALTLALAALTSCGDPSGTTQTRGRRTLSLAVAASMKFACNDLLAAFRAGHPDIEVTAAFGSSGSFFAQIQNRAPHDLFLSADTEYPQKLIESGFAAKGDDFLYARGRLVLWVGNETHLNPAKDQMKVLLDAKVRKIAIANPKFAPYGRAAEAAMHKAGVYEPVKDKIVLGENIAQTAQYLESGAAEAGLIAQSLAVNPAMTSKGAYWLVPQDLHPPIEQSGVILKAAKDRAAVQAFKAFLLSDEGAAILHKHGFAPGTPAKSPTE